MKLILSLLLFLCAGNLTPLRALTYVRYLEEPNPSRHSSASSRSKNPQASHPVAPSRVTWVYPKAVSYMSQKQALDDQRRLAQRRAETQRSDFGDWRAEAHRQSLAQQRALAQRRTTAKQGIVTYSTTSASSRNTPQRVAVSAKPSGPPSGYYTFNRTHWAKNGTNRLADVKANHHPRCPGCGH